MDYGENSVENVENPCKTTFLHPFYSTVIPYNNEYTVYIHCQQLFYVVC